MFALRFFCNAFFAPRFFPKVGAASAPPVPHSGWLGTQRPQGWIGANR
jgi:hypothetical protein